MIIIAAAIAPALFTLLQASPTPGPGDPRLQTIEYNPHQIVRLEVGVGYHLTVMFAPDERIESVAIGDSAAWQATTSQRRDNLFLKPLTASTSTNLTVITDARTYSFELVPASDGSAPFIVRFTYRPAVQVRIAKSPPASPPGRYRLTGDKALRPGAIQDDGTRTFISWPAKASMPAVFARDERGEEVLVDGNMIDDRYVVPRIYSRFIFRIGKHSAFADRRAVK